MKRLFLYLVVSTASLVFVGCSSGVSSERADAVNTESVTYRSAPTVVDAQVRAEVLDAAAGGALDAEFSSEVDAVGPQQDVELGPEGDADSMSVEGDAEPSEPEEASGAPVEMNAGWIGGPCPDDLACDYAQGTCLLESEGFFEGHCSQPCDLYCPDQDGAVTTFCVDPEELSFEASEGLCVMQCDFGVSPTGCREGYYCGSVARYGQPETVKFVCLPGEAPEVEMSDCMLELVERGVGFSIGVNPMDSPDEHPELLCDVTDPVWVDGTMAGVNFRYASPSGEIKRIFSACELALAMHDTATLVATEGVTDIIHLGVYNCRVISGTSTLSQHAFANAIDISGFQLEDGTYWTVFDDWEDGVADPLTTAGDWLLWFANELYAQWIFNIILTPEYNAAHDDHFHADLTPGAHSLH